MLDRLTDQWRRCNARRDGSKLDHCPKACPRCDRGLNLRARIERGDAPQ